MNKNQATILSDISSAKQSIKIAVSWLTDLEILARLIEKARNRVKIEVITSSDEWNILRFEKFQTLQNLGAIINKKGSPDVFQDGFMHFKFYIIDDKLARGGSYNFTANAVTQDNQLKTIVDPVEFKETLDEFNDLLKNSKDFFTDISQPEQIRAALEPLERQGVSPERRKEFEMAISARRMQEEAEKQKEINKKLMEEKERSQYGIKSDAPAVSEAPPRSYAK